MATCCGSVCAWLLPEGIIQKMMASVMINRATEMLDAENFSLSLLPMM